MSPTPPLTPPPALATPRVKVTRPSGWDARCRSFSIDARSRRFREQLGLPDDRPVIMTGHQPTIWHAGILAKYLAADALARQFRGVQARLVVDQDDDDPFALRVPIVDDHAITGEATVNFAEGWRAGQPSRSRPSAAIRAIPDLRYALPSVERGVRRVHDALAAHASSASAADQVAGALDDLIAPLTDKATSYGVMATRLAQTDLYKDLLGRMFDDPRGMAASYNRAVAAFPDAGVKPLSVTDARTELPLWHRTPDGLTRTQVLSDHRPRIEHTAAKALFMTGLFRLAGCDLFIHGTGGLVYDRVTEHWFRDWLGDEVKNMAPMIGVTADLYLPLPHADYTTASAARAKWLAHSAAHNPALARDDAHARRKRELLQRINAAPRDSAERSSLYRELHALLDEYHSARSASLDELNAEAARADALIAAGELARDRTWAFPLHPDDALRALREHTRASVLTH